MKRVLAVDQKRRNNAELIRDAALLGYLHRDIRTLDCTYKYGRFWKLFRPDDLVGSDLDPEYSPVGYSVDFTALPWADAEFGQVVIDPPYQLNGTSTGEGPAAKDADYAVTEYMNPDALHDLIRAGISECARVLAPAERVRVDKGRYELRGGILLVKCQAQVCNGDIHWQQRMFAEHAESLGLVHEDELMLLGLRAQPTRTRKHQDCAGLGCAGCVDGRVASRQEHAARNYSSLLVCRKPPPRGSR